MKKFTQEIKDKNTLIRKEINEIKTINNNIIDIIVEKIKTDDEYALAFCMVNFALIFTCLHFASDTLSKNNPNGKHYQKILELEKKIIAEKIMPQKLTDLDNLLFNDLEELCIYSKQTKVDENYNGYIEFCFFDNFKKIVNVCFNKFPKLNFDFVISVCGKCKYFTVCKNQGICLKKLKI